MSVAWVINSSLKNVRFPLTLFETALQSSDVADPLSINECKVILFISVEEIIFLFAYYHFLPTNTAIFEIHWKKKKRFTYLFY